MDQPSQLATRVSSTVSVLNVSNFCFCNALNRKEFFERRTNGISLYVCPYTELARFG
jgi:hypothetical protein